MSKAFDKRGVTFGSIPRLIALRKHYFRLGDSDALPNNLRNRRIILNFLFFSKTILNVKQNHITGLDEASLPLGGKSGSNFFVSMLLNLWAPC